MYLLHCLQEYVRTFFQLLLPNFEGPEFQILYIYVRLTSIAIEFNI